MRTEREVTTVSGLRHKYIIMKADGSPTDLAADYFVLRLDTDPRARHAARTYARNVAAENPALAEALEKRCAHWAFEEMEQDEKEEGYFCD